MSNDGITNEELEAMILDGLVEFAGLDTDTGEFLYSFTPKMYKENPRVLMESILAIKHDLEILMDAGFIIVDLEDENPSIYLTGMHEDPEMVGMLSVQHQKMLSFIVSILTNF
jgi:hypothetical protein